MITQSASQSILNYLGYARISLDFISPIVGIKNWPEYFGDLFRLKGKSLLIYHLRNGLNYKVRTSTHDRAILMETNLKKIYNPRGFNIKSKDIIVDIGAQIGMFAVMAAKSAINGRVIAFEPEANNYSLLINNILLNNIETIQASNRAVTAKTGRGRLRLDSGNTGGHSMFIGSKRRTRTVSVHAISLRDIIANYRLSHIDFLKIDAEGAEFDILFNLDDRTLKVIRKIAMECHQLDRERNYTTMQKYLEKRGYTVFTKGRTGFPIVMLYAKRKEGS